MNFGGGSLLYEQGQLDEAAAMKKESLDKMKQVLGEDYHFILPTMDDLAVTLEKNGQLEEAVAVRKEALQKRTQTSEKII